MEVRQPPRLLHDHADPTSLLLAQLSVPLQSDDLFHPRLWLAASALFWIALAVAVIPIYAAAGNALWHTWRAIQTMRRGGSTMPSSSKRADGSATVLLVSPASELPWGSRFQLAYSTLIPSKRAYMRRLLRSFVYYLGAVIAGFYFLLSYMRSPVDFYRVYTPGMDCAFAFAATHFLWCCVEDWPCRAHMGRTRREQLAVFWGYIIHHLLTASAFLLVMHSRELGSMCAMGLTFEGPVFFACLRELVALYDEDFDLFTRVPSWMQALNWKLAFLALIPCRLFSAVMFLYSAFVWTQEFLLLLSPVMQVAYFVFGMAFLGINCYFTWLLGYWKGQDQRYLRKKRERIAANKERGEAQNGIDRNITAADSGAPMQPFTDRTVGPRPHSPALQAGGPAAMFASMAAGSAQMPAPLQIVTR